MDGEESGWKSGFSLLQARLKGTQHASMEAWRDDGGTSSSRKSGWKSV